jgi:hypothetical protein
MRADLAADGAGSLRARYGPLAALVEEMVAEDPQRRPPIEDVLERLTAFLDQNGVLPCFPLPRSFACALLCLLLRVLLRAMFTHASAVMWCCAGGSRELSASTMALLTAD